jgi:glutaminyl-tRNA synthetase
LFFKLEVESIEELLRIKMQLHAVGENSKTDGYVITPNTAELLKKHVEAVGGKVGSSGLFLLI